jgi:chromosomal replication initiator protein
MVNLTSDGKVEASICSLVWANASSFIQDSLESDKFHEWINPLIPLPGQTNRLVLEAPNHFFKTYINSTYLQVIESAVRQACIQMAIPALEVDLAANENLPLDPARPTDWQEELAREPRLPGLEGQRNGFTQPFNPWFTFENFVVGESNEMAYQCCQAFSKGRQLGNNLLLVISNTGLGKSHLAQAAGSEVSHKDKKVFYLMARDYTAHYVNAIHKKDYESFNNDYKKSDFFVVEDITFFSKKPQFQEEICSVVDYLLNKGAKVVFTSTQPPGEIPYLSPSCRSRLSSALMTHINAPSYETRLKILTNLVKAYSYKMPPQVLEMVAENITSDVRLLQSCLTSLKAKSEYENKPVDLSLARDILSFSTKSPSSGEALTKIKDLICTVYSVDEKTLVSKNVTKTLNHIRSIAIYLAKHMTSHSYTEIGRAFNRQHTTILYTYNKMVMALQKDEKMRYTVDYLIKQLGQKI